MVFVLDILHKTLIMSDEKNGMSLLMQGDHTVGNHFTIVPVKISSRLICDDKFRF